MDRETLDALRSSGKGDPTPMHCGCSPALILASMCLACLVKCCARLRPTWCLRGGSGC